MGMHLPQKQMFRKNTEIFLVNIAKITLSSLLLFPHTIFRRCVNVFTGAVKGSFVID